MADYDIYFYCEECKQTHPLGVKISITDEHPPEKLSVGAFYAGKQLPPEIANHVDSQILCPKRGKMYTQKDLNQIFLEPIK
jgi:hypothetical protein